MISNLRLQNFRSYKDESFEFEGGVNIVVGPNASGKTNLLEAVLVLCRGGSFRVKDVELIKFDQPWARLDSLFNNHTRVLKMEKVNQLLDKTYLIDDKPQKRLSLDKTIPVVYFEPNHLQLITRGPDQRRDYFDDLLERTTPGYKSILSSYRRALAQRNSLLKQDPSRAKSQLFAWNVRLSELGEKIAQHRSSLASDINVRLSKTYSKISKKKTAAELIYESQLPVDSYANKLLRKLEANISVDLERGFTGSGPHREDFLFKLKDQPAGITASRGENRSLMLAIKVFELDLVEKARGQKALLLLDDVFSELDGARRRALVEFLEDRQTIITTTDADAVVEFFSNNHNTIALS